MSEQPGDERRRARTNGGPIAGAAVVLLFCGAALAAQQPSPAPPQEPETGRPTFEARAELVLVDVTVVDRSGAPVPDLTSAEFELQVNGQRRAITALQFVSTVAGTDRAPLLREAGSTSNQAATSGRLLVFAVDEGNLRADSSRAVLRAAESMMDRLAPGDMVALARLPNGMGNVEFTADRARIREALITTRGTLTSQGSMWKVRISEAYALEYNDTVTWELAVDRECSSETGPMREVCSIALEEEARALMSETVRRTRMTIRGLEALMGRLVTLRTPINIVMISEGLFVARDRDDMSTLVHRAAEARATIHVIRPAQAFFDVSDRTSTSGPSQFNDDGMLSEGLEQLAGQTRGSMTTINATPGAAFDRLGRELSGYYLIGFEPTDADRTGTERRIRVQVRPRGLTVRARPTFAIRDAPAEAAVEAAAATTLDPMEALKLALVAPLPERALPIRVASYNVTDAGSPKVRVVITAEVGEPASDEVEWPIGILVFDKDDEVVLSQAGPAKVAPASSHGDSPRLLLTSVLLDPGDYTLRLAAVDTLGRAGSVHHPVHVGFAPVADRLSVSDLVLAAQPTGASGAPRPRPGNVVDGNTLTAMIEMISADPAQIGQASVTVQVTDSEAGAPLVSAAARPAARGDGRRAFAATLELGVLPPGEYQARALLSAPGVPETSIVRAFLLSPPRVPTLDRTVDLSAPGDPDRPPAGVAARIIAPVPTFSAQTVLAPEVLRPFLDGLEVLHPPSMPEVAALLEQARHGIFTSPEIPGATLDDRATMGFVRGLQAYQKGEVARAAAWFRQTLKDASDFMGAAFYLGASQAASGRDSDAVTAWEMALLSENPGAVYPPLVDALLRLGDGREAVDVLGEAPEAWASDSARLRREAIAEAMLGAYDAALSKLQELLITQKGDQNLLFLAIQVLYRLHAEGPGLTESQQALFADYVARHQDLGGPNTALVEVWRKFVLP